MASPLHAVAPAQDDLESRLSARLLDSELVSAAQLREVKVRQKSGKRSFPQTLVDLDVLDSSELLPIISELLDVAAIDLKTTPGDASVLELLPRSLAFELQVIPLFAVAGELTLATSEPYDLEKLDAVRFATGLKVLPVFTLEADLERHLTAYYGEYDPNFDPFAIEYEGQEDERGYSLDNPEAEVEKPTVRLVNLVLSSCIGEGASDIHLEPQSTSMRVRSRVDGVMRVKPYEIPREAESGVVVRIKILASLDISEKRRPQDGKIRLRFQKRKIDVRVSTFPSIHGEKIVLRILDKEKSNFQLDNIGMEPAVLEGWRGALQGLEGILLVTGPTGSGKSSTLYATLRHLMRPEVNIVTLEDPVEYELDGVTQGQVHVAAGFTFASGLRSILRQDPDIVLVGEIRDGETAEIAARAAITGHLVLATLHTNGAPAAVARLIDLGLDPFLTASALRGVLAQRLVRRVCGNCAAERPLDDFEKAELDGWIDPDSTIVAGVGCPSCDDTGYSGRTGIHELLVADSALRAVISERPSESAILEAAREKAFTTLWMDGVEKVKGGVTTPRELLRVAPRHERFTD